MTEYDYSPDAYNRYLHTQNRVSNWVSQTKAHERQYANPFVPSAANGPPPPPSPPPPRPAVQPQRSKSFGSSGTAIIRPRDMNANGSSPQRSKTLDSRESRETESPSRHSRSRSFSHTHDSRSKPRSRSHHSHHSHSHSHSQSHSHPRSHGPPPPMPMPMHMNPPIRSNSTPPVYKAYDIRTGEGPVHLPAPRPGETYVIIPPGRRVEMISSKGSVIYPNNPHSPRPHGGVYGAKEPLLKRLLGSITWSNHPNGSHEGSSSERKARRRKSY